MAINRWSSKFSNMVKSSAADSYRSRVWVLRSLLLLLLLPVFSLLTELTVAPLNYYICLESMELSYTSII